MGSLILCHAKKARQPYEINRVHMRIYTLEELCYYIFHHLYLLDNTFANYQLCDWIREELELCELAEDLKTILNDNGKIEDFILRILEDASIYSIYELDLVKEDLRIYNEQNFVEKEKFKADQLLQSGELESSILIYLRIVNQPWDESVSPEFYGRIYACLGAIYGKQFLYSLAANMYKEACKYLEDDSVQKAYLYSCYMAYPKEEYQLLLDENPAFSEIDKELQERINKVKNHVSVTDTDTMIVSEKNKYRRFHKI